VSVEGSIVEGVPHAVIRDLSHRCDLVIIGRHGEGSETKSRHALGETAEHVIRQVGKPILVMTPPPFPRLQKFLVAFDASHYADEVLPVAAELAERLHSEMLVVAVLDDAAMATAALDTARSILAAYPLSPQYLARHGEPVETLLATAREFDCDVLATGSVGEHRLREFMLGSVCEALLRTGSLCMLVKR
jgi:nucleotide-binding universal stress UspA family protein